jgi:hypothetical protein
VQGVPFAPGATARLDGQRARVELIRLRALVELGRPAEALGGLEDRVAGDALDEAATALLMRALYLLGRPSEALTRFGELSARLADQGQLPGPALRDLESAVLRHDAVLDPPAAATGAPAVRPFRPAGVVGRDDVWDMLTPPGDGSPRWFVLAGEAGIGKTYLAEATAFADRLAAVDDHGFLYQARAAVSGATSVARDALAPRLAAVLDEPPSWHRVTRLRVVGLLVADLGLTELVPDVERALAPFAGELVVLGTALACGGTGAAGAGPPRGDRRSPRRGRGAVRGRAGGRRGDRAPGLGRPAGAGPGGGPGRGGGRPRGRRRGRPGAGRRRPAGPGGRG